MLQWELPALFWPLKCLFHFPIVLHWCDNTADGLPMVFVSSKAVVPKDEYRPGRSISDSQMIGSKKVKLPLPQLVTSCHYILTKQKPATACYWLPKIGEMASIPGLDHHYNPDLCRTALQKAVRPWRPDILLQIQFQKKLEKGKHNKSVDPWDFYFEKVILDKLKILYQWWQFLIVLVYRPTLWRCM